MLRTVDAHYLTTPTLTHKYHAYSHYLKVFLPPSVSWLATRVIAGDIGIEPAIELYKNLFCHLSSSVTMRSAERGCDASRCWKIKKQYFSFSSMFSGLSETVCRTVESMLYEKASSLK